MTWEEEMLMDRRQGPLRSKGDPDEKRRKRSKRLRYFLTVWGAKHWAERVDGRRIVPARRGHISL
jgi:hypothetical protein